MDARQNRLFMNKEIYFIILKGTFHEECVTIVKCAWCLNFSKHNTKFERILEKISLESCENLIHTSFWGLPLACSYPHLAVCLHPLLCKWMKRERERTLSSFYKATCLVGVGSYLWPQLAWILPKDPISKYIHVG
jgi:hypothetical protein